MATTKKKAAPKNHTNYICFNLYNGFPDDVTVEENLNYADSYDYCIKVTAKGSISSTPKMVGEITVG